MFLQSAAENATEDAEKGLPPKYTPEEIETITKRLKASETWLNEGVTNQKAVKRCGDSDPVLLSAEMKARGSALQRDVMKMLKRKAPKKKLTTSASESSTSDGSSSTTSESTASTTSTSTTAAESAQQTHTRDEL
jgi:hypoxia up-regulated 1